VRDPGLMRERGKIVQNIISRTGDEHDERSTQRVHFRT
jgi:hypothetical protein